jgi:hypothetical protein
MEYTGGVQKKIGKGTREEEMGNFQEIVVVD